MLKRHDGTTQDSTGCEFHYTCYAEKYMTSDGRKTERHYVVYDGKGRGKNHVVVEADSLKELKVLMGA